MTVRLKPVGVLALAAGALVLTTAAQAADSWDSVIAAAKQEGKVTIYAGTSHPIIDQEIKAFSAKYPGITFTILDGEGNDLTARIDQEASTNNHVADVYVAVDAPWIADANKRGIIAALTGPAAGAFPVAFRIGNTYKIALEAGGIIINTDEVKRPIKGYEDLVGPEFAGGKLGVQQWSAGAVSPSFNTYLDKNFPGLLDKIAAQKPVIYRSSESAAASVASGELAGVLYAVPAVPKSLMAKGAPINWILPPNPYGVAVDVNVIANAPHPNASELFADFLVSADGQKIWNPPGSGQSSPLGFGDFTPASITVVDPSAWPADQVAKLKAIWQKRFGG